MRKNKIISIVLAIILCFTATILVVTADTKSASIAITTDKSSLSAGESATVSVNITTDFPVATMSIPVFYDKTMVSVSDATATLSDYAVKSTTTDSQSVNSSKIYDNTNIDSSKYGFVLVTYIASAGSDVASSIDDTVLTFNVTAKSDVEGDALINCVAESAKTSTNAAGMLYFGSPASGTTVDSVPENVEEIDLETAATTITIGGSSAEPNTLILNENAPFEAIIDLVNNGNGEYTGTIYGFDTVGINADMTTDGTIADFVTTAYGDEYLEINVGDAGMETTGTIINVLDADGNVVESYVYILFGDMDMDAWVGGSDAYMAEYYENFLEGIDTVISFMAGDVDGDAWCGGSDAYAMEYFENFLEGMPAQSELGVINVNNVYELIGQ